MSFVIRVDPIERKAEEILFNTVVLNREPLGSVREEFLIPGRKFAPGSNRGGKVVEKNLNYLFLLVYSTHKKCTARLV